MRGLPIMAAWTAPSHWRTRPAVVMGKIMRTLRGLVTVAAVVALFGTAVGAATAQDETDREYTTITGTAVAGTRTGDPDITVNATIPQEVATGMAYRSMMNTSDPRLCGRYENVQNYYGLAGGSTGGAVRMGTGRLTNEGGSWKAEFQGFTEPGTDALSSTYYMTRFEGEDGYEGLSAVTMWLPTNTGRWDIEGVLFPGEMPPMPEVPAE
mgnify:CR=1 FL=1